MNKYILVDSGIDTNCNNMSGSILGGISISYRGGNIVVNENFQDENGHGTSCASIINSISKNCGMFIIKIMNEDGRGKIESLLKALEFSLNLDIRVICLSIATIHDKYIYKLKSLINKLKNNGKIIVTSLHNNYQSSYPANFNEVIGIKGADFGGNFSQYYFDKNNNIQGIFDGIPNFARTINNRYCMFRGNSKANAVAVGNILNLLKSDSITFEELLLELENNSTCMPNFSLHSMNRKHENKLNKYKESLFDEIYPIICNTLNKNIDKEYIFHFPLMTKAVGFTFHTIYDLLTNIEKQYNIKFEYEKIHGYNVATIYNLIDLLDGAI